MSFTVRVKYFIYTLLCAFFVWFFRLFHEAVIFPWERLETLWLVFLKPIVTILLGLGVAWLFFRLRQRCSTKEFWNWSFVAAAIFCIPYIPDMYASFVKAGEKRAVLLSVAFYTLGILTYGLVRGGVTTLLVQYLNKFLSGTPLKLAFLYVAMLLGEFLFFHSWHPITYFPALPLPLPAARFETHSASSGIKYVLFETKVDASMREQLASGGELAMSILGERLAQNLASQFSQKDFSESVVIVLPETFVSLETPDSVFTLMQPVLGWLFENTKVQKVAWVQGAFLKNNNVVLGAEVSRENLTQLRSPSGTPVLTVIRKKREQMPMFEAPSKGVSYSERLNDGEVTETIVPTEQQVLKDFVDSHQILICYESLFPSNWSFKKPTLVLTNHHLFNEYHLMNWVYFGFLRQLSFVFNSDTKVVSNYNPSGLLRSFPGVGLAEASSPEPVAVVRFPGERE